MAKIIALEQVLKDIQGVFTTFLKQHVVIKKSRRSFINTYKKAVQEYMDKLHKENQHFPKVIVKKKKLPRKLKKAYKKKGIIELELIQCVETISLDIELGKGQK